MGFRRSEVRILSPRHRKGLWYIDLCHRPFYYALLYPIALPLWEASAWPANLSGPFRK